VRILHLTDRLSARGGADWHLLGVLARLAPEAQLVVAVGRDDGTAIAPCPTTQVAALARAERAPCRPALDRLAAEVAPEAVHVHNVMNPAALEWAAERGAVMTVQDHRVFCPGRGKLTAAGHVCQTAMSPAACSACFDDESYFERLAALTRERLEAVARMQAITVLSRYMARELAAVGVDAARLEVIPPFAFGLAEGEPAAGPPCVLFSGRLVAAKGVWDAVAAWRLAEVDLPLVFAGTGSERQALEAEGFEVLGWVPHEGMAPVYRRARALLFPSRWQEPFGIAGLEALTLGLPVAAWDSGGVREWAGDDVAPWGDVVALAARLRRALAEEAVAAPPGFEEQALMAALWDVYRRVA
jgi:glycosyltransferase involved in cell wall biosynthesis